MQNSNLDNSARVENLIVRTIEELKVSLTDKVIITEAGSGLYLYMPVIAALTGAEEVIVCVKDTGYGKADDIIRNCKGLIERLSINTTFTFRKNQVEIQDLNRADVVTNSGMLRPLDREKIKHMKSSAVIPLMYEKWELRSCDIDIAAAKEFGIKVAGTSESTKQCAVFQYVGPLVLKLCLEAGYEVLNNKIVLWSSDAFGDEIEHYFVKCGANIIRPKTIDELYQQCQLGTEILILADYKEKRNLNDFSNIDFKYINEQNSKLGLIHLFGDLNFDLFSQIFPVVYPFKDGYVSTMSQTLAYVGPTPFVKLMCAGFKVAEECILERYSELTQLITE